jgi:hypothetical protein
MAPSFFSESLNRPRMEEKKLSWSWSICKSSTQSRYKGVGLWASSGVFITGQISEKIPSSLRRSRGGVNPGVHRFQQVHTGEASPGQSFDDQQKIDIGKRGGLIAGHRPIQAHGNKPISEVNLEGLAVFAGYLEKPVTD